jgi:hypothetical protein
MLAQPGFLLMVAGGFLVAAGFIGLVFSRRAHEVHPVLDQMADDPVRLPAWFSTDSKTFGRATPKQTRPATAQNPRSVQAWSGRKSLTRTAAVVKMKP